MRTRITLCALAALSLSACQKAESGKTPVSAPAADAAPAAESYRDVDKAAPPRPAISVPQLAYVHSYGLAAPPDSVRGLVARHEQVCWAAGAQVCQVTGSNIREDGPDKIAATLSLRAQPEWLRVFRQGLESDVKAAGGRMVQTDTATDDLSRILVDTEAALRARTLLRDRLEQALRTRSGKVSEVFEMEQQLAQVQGEIDAARSELAMMKTRVATSELKIDYRSEGVLAPRGTLGPVAMALDDVAGLFVGMLALLIRAIAVAAPVAGLAALVWWVSRRIRRRKAPAA